MCYTHISVVTNNTVKLHALEQGLELLVKTNDHHFTIERDLTLVIKGKKRIQCGSNIGKITKHLHLSQIMQ